MADYISKLLPRFRYGVIQPRANEEVSRARSYQLYKLLPLDFIEIATGLGLENYTEEGVEKAIKNYWTCVDRLVKEKVDHIIFSGAPISAVSDPHKGAGFTQANQREDRHHCRRAVGSAARGAQASRSHENRCRQPLGRQGQQRDHSVLERRRHRSPRHHQKKSVGVGFLRHEPGARFGKWRSKSVAKPREPGPRPKPSQSPAAPPWRSTSSPPSRTNLANRRSPT